MIPLMPTLGVDHQLPILYLFKKMVHIYTPGKTMNQFAIGYMINTSLKFNNAFRTQVEKYLGVSFYIRTMKNIKNCLMKKNTSIMEIITIYENNEEIPKQIVQIIKLCC